MSNTTTNCAKDIGNNEKEHTHLVEDCDLMSCNDISCQTVLVHTDKELPVTECSIIDLSCLHVWEQVKFDRKSIKTNFSTLQSTVCFLSSAVELSERYLREIHENKEHITSLEQKIVKLLEKERNSLQLATRLIAQDKYCKPSLNAEVWQSAQGIVRQNNINFCEKNAPQPQSDDVVINNRFEILNDENMNCCYSTLPKQISQVSQKT